MPAGFRARTALLPGGLFRRVGLPGQPRFVQSPFRGRRIAFALSSLLFHLLTIGLLSWGIAKLAPPDRPE